MFRQAVSNTDCVSDVTLGNCWHETSCPWWQINSQLNQLIDLTKSTKKTIDRRQLHFRK